MKKLLNALRRLTLRNKTILAVLLILTLTLTSVSVTISRYSTKYYTKLQQQYNEQIIKELSGQLDTMYAAVEELYLTFNTQQPFTFDTTQGTTVFQSVRNQILFESSVLNVINANNLQTLIIGTLFYLNNNCYWYVGSNSVAEGFDFSATSWYQEYLASGGKRLLIGPIQEDFKPVNTTRYDCVYYIARYGSVSPSAPLPFILFTIRLDSLLKPVDAYLQDGRRAVVTDQNGTVIHAVGFSDDAEATALLSDTFEDTQPSNSAVSRFVDDNYICSYYLNALKWHVYFIDSTETMFRERNEMNRNIDLIVIAFALISLLIATIMIRRITMPLTVLNRFIDIMQEDPDAYIDEPIPGSEIGKIGHRLNEMKHSLKKMNEDLYLVSLQEKEAQVSALQAQINPHFLYNTLDNIYCIAQLGETEPILCLSERLSLMMRYSMSMKQNLVPLRAELEHVQNFVAILNVRFDNRIHLVNRIPPELDRVMVLKISLQPLVENAWRHGLLSSKSPFGVITLLARIEDQTLYLIVENDGECIPQDRCDALNRALSQVHYGESSYNSGHGIALDNINNRIKLTFGNEYGLRLQNRPEGGCQVVMSLPLLDSPAEGS